MKRKASRAPAYERPVKLTKPSSSVTVDQTLNKLLNIKSVRQPKFEPLKLPSFRQKKTTDNGESSPYLLRSNSSRQGLPVTARLQFSAPATLSKLKSRNSHKKTSQQESTSVDNARKNNQGNATRIQPAPKEVKKPQGDNNQRTAAKKRPSSAAWPNFPALIPPSKRGRSNDQRGISKQPSQNATANGAEDSTNGAESRTSLRKRSTLKIENSPSPPSAKKGARRPNFDTVLTSPGSLAKQDTEILDHSDGSSSLSRKTSRASTVSSSGAVVSKLSSKRISKRNTITAKNK